MSGEHLDDEEGGSYADLGEEVEEDCSNKDYYSHEGGEYEEDSEDGDVELVWLGMEAR